MLGLAAGCADPAPGGPAFVVDGAHAECVSVTSAVRELAATARLEVHCRLDPFPAGIDDECTAQFFVELTSPLAVGAHPIDVESTFSYNTGSSPAVPDSSINRAGGDVLRAWASGVGFNASRSEGMQLATGMLDVQTREGVHVTGRLSVELSGRMICSGPGTTSSADLTFDGDVLTL